MPKAHARKKDARRTLQCFYGFGYRWSSVPGNVYKPNGLLTIRHLLESLKRTSPSPLMPRKTA